MFIIAHLKTRTKYCILIKCLFDYMTILCIHKYIGNYLLIYMYIMWMHPRLCIALQFVRGGLQSCEIKTIVFYCCKGLVGHSARKDLFSIMSNRTRFWISLGIKKWSRCSILEPNHLVYVDAKGPSRRSITHMRVI